tara:strand:- start:234 stop:476 length:243 start_codon:yes stop_codon:yes gene_type:complete
MDYIDIDLDGLATQLEEVQSHSQDMVNAVDDRLREIEDARQIFEEAGNDLDKALSIISTLGDTLTKLDEAEGTLSDYNLI